MNAVRVNLLLLLLAGPAHAASPWYFTTLAQSVYTEYSGATERSSLTGWGVYGTAEYLDALSFTLGLNDRSVRYADRTAIDENHTYASARMSRSIDQLRGMVSLRADIHRLEDESEFASDRVRVNMLLAGFRNRKSSRYVELGYAESLYTSTGELMEDLRIEQWSPAWGQALNEQHWVQLRGYLIQHDSGRHLNDTGTMRALEIKWTRTLALKNRSGLEKFTLGFTAGESMYAVDPDTSDVFSLSDLQRSALTLAATWRVGSGMRVLAAAGKREFTRLETDEDYSGAFVYLNFAKSW